MMVEKKQCPYCNGDLEVGVSYAGRASYVIWMPRYKSLSLRSVALQSKKLTADGAFIIKSREITGVRFTSWICRSCGYLITFADGNKVEYDPNYQPEED